MGNIETIILLEFCLLQSQDDTPTVSTTEIKRQSILERIGQEHAERILAEEELLLESRSKPNFDTARADIENIPTNYSIGEEGAPGQEPEKGETFKHITKEKEKVQKQSEKH